MADTRSLVFFPSAPSSMVELNTVCDVFRRNNVCYCTEVGVQMHGQEAVVLTWFKYHKAVRSGRPVGTFGRK